MPLFKCSKCACIENTALSRYWSRNLGDPTRSQPALCSECDPIMGRWHGDFPKKPAAGHKLGDDGFLYRPEEVGPGGYFAHLIKSGQLKIVGDA